MRARIRSVKPEILTDEKLWDLGVNTGFPILQAFEGLWMYSDREGRFEWRARALKTLILPYWDGDMEAVLTALAEAGFILRYEVDGRVFGAVRNFKRHQTPNPKENQSVIPAPFEDDSGSNPPPTQSVTRENPSSLQKVSSGKGSGKGIGNGKGGGSPPALTRVLEADPEPPPPLSAAQDGAEGEFGPSLMANVFARTWRSVRNSAPNMAGEIGDLPERVVATAKLRGADPRALFTSLAHRYASKPDLKDREKSYPYACFAAAWGELVDRAQPSGPPKRDIGKLMTLRKEAMFTGDSARVEAIDREMSEGGEHANAGR